MKIFWAVNVTMLCLLLIMNSLTLHCQFCRARILSNLHTVRALVI